MWRRWNLAQNAMVMDEGIQTNCTLPAYQPLWKDLYQLVDVELRWPSLLTRTAPSRGACPTANLQFAMHTLHDALTPVNSQCSDHQCGPIQLIVLKTKSALSMLANRLTALPL